VIEELLIHNRNKENYAIVCNPRTWKKWQVTTWHNTHKGEDGQTSNKYWRARSRKIFYSKNIVRSKSLFRQMGRHRMLSYDSPLGWFLIVTYDVVGTTTWSLRVNVRFRLATTTRWSRRFSRSTRTTSATSSTSSSRTRSTGLLKGYLCTRNNKIVSRDFRYRSVKGVFTRHNKIVSRNIAGQATHW
jgi:hypothetical protein